jgi:hypothetical protein
MAVSHASFQVLQLHPCLFWASRGIVEISRMNGNVRPYADRTGRRRGSVFSARRLCELSRCRFSFGKRCFCQARGTNVWCTCYRNVVVVSRTIKMTGTFGRNHKKMVFLARWVLVSGTVSCLGIPLVRALGGNLEQCIDDLENAAGVLASVGSWLSTLSPG